MRDWPKILRVRWPKITREYTGLTPSVNQRAQNASVIDRIPREVTVIDPAHPFCGRTFPL